MLAREKKVDYEKIFERLEKFKEMHIHFSGIEYGEKGEKNHKPTEREELKELLNSIPSDKQVVIINESPIPIEDSMLGLSLYKQR